MLGGVSEEVPQGGDGWRLMGGSTGGLTSGHQESGASPDTPVPPVNPLTSTFGFAG